MLRLRDVMTPDPIALGADRTIGDAIRTLDSAPIRHLPVLEGGAVVGMLTDRSLRPWRASLMSVERWDEAGLRQLLLDEPVRQHMTTQVLFLGPDTPVTEVIDLMCDERIGAVPVVDREQGLIGIVSTIDLLRHQRRMLTEAEAD